MANIFKVLGFFTGIFTIMFFVGGMPNNGMIFLLQTVLFIGLGFVKLNEKMYLYIFMGYLTLFFIGFTYYATF